MKIAPMSMTTNFKSNPASFKKSSQPIERPLVKLTDKTPDDAIVAYGTCGPNYVYPIYASQVRQRNQAKDELKHEKINAKPNTVKEETPEEYYRRKVYSTEWTT